MFISVCYVLLLFLVLLFSTLFLSLVVLMKHFVWFYFSLSQHINYTSLFSVFSSRPRVKYTITANPNPLSKHYATSCIDQGSCNNKVPLISPSCALSHCGHSSHLYISRNYWIHGCYYYVGQTYLLDKLRIRNPPGAFSCQTCPHWASSNSSIAAQVFQSWRWFLWKVLLLEFSAHGILLQ